MYPPYLIVTCNDDTNVYFAGFRWWKWSAVPINRLIVRTETGRTEIPAMNIRQLEVVTGEDEW